MSSLHFFKDNTRFFQVSSPLQQQFLFSLVLLNFLLQNMCYTLVGTWEEMVSKDNLFVTFKCGIMVNSRVQVEQQWQINLLLWIQKLIFEAKALNFVEINGDLLWADLVDSDSSNWFIRSVVNFVECKCCLASIYDKLSSFWLEFPRNLIFSVTHESYGVFSEHVDFFFCKSIVLRMLRHRESQSLANNIVERNGQKVATKQKQTETVNSVKLTPFGFFFENFIHLHCLTAFSYTKRKLFLLQLLLESAFYWLRILEYSIIDLNSSDHCYSRFLFFLNPRLILIRLELREEKGTLLQNLILYLLIQVSVLLLGARKSSIIVSWPWQTNHFYRPKKT